MFQLTKVRFQIREQIVSAVVLMFVVMLLCIGMALLGRTDIDDKWHPWKDDGLVILLVIISILIILSVVLIIYSRFSETMKDIAELERQLAELKKD